MAEQEHDVIFCTHPEQGWTEEGFVLEVELAADALLNGAIELFLLLRSGEALQINQLELHGVSRNDLSRGLAIYGGEFCAQAFVTCDQLVHGLLHGTDVQSTAQPPCQVDVVARVRVFK